MRSVFFRSSMLYILYTHIYTHNRIKDNWFVRRTNFLHNTFCNILYAIGLKGNSSPHIGVGGEEFPTKQVRFNIVYCNDCKPSAVVRGWFCLVLEKEAGRKWICKVSDDSVPSRKRGWVCDCGHHTFGDDKWHNPIYSRIKGRVVFGRLKGCRR